MLRRALLLALALGLVAPQVAEAHGSHWDRIADVGPFRARVSATIANGQLDYTIDLRDRQGRPVRGAFIRVFARTPGGELLDADAVAVGSTYEARLPASDLAEWRDWTIDTGIEAGGSNVTFSYRPPAPSWRWHAIWPVLIGIALTLAAFGQAFVRLRRRGRSDHAPWSRAALAVAATAILGIALCSPIDAIGERYLLSVHMLQHVMLGDLAPALVLLAVRGPLAVFLVPKPILRRVAHWEGPRAFLAAVLHPAIAVSLWAITYATWHLPPLYQAALRNPTVHELEHATFTICGLLVWAQLIDPTRRLRLTRKARLGVALGTFLAGQLLADVLIFSYSPYYGQYAAEPWRIAGIGALADQRIAGVVMMTEQLATFGVCIAILLRRTVRAQAIAVSA